MGKLCPFGTTQPSPGTPTCPKCRQHPLVGRAPGEVDGVAQLVGVNEEGSELPQEPGDGGFAAPGASGQADHVGARRQSGGFLRGRGLPSGWGVAHKDPAGIVAAPGPAERGPVLPWGWDVPKAGRQTPKCPLCGRGRAGSSTPGCHPCGSPTSRGHRAFTLQLTQTGDPIWDPKTPTVACFLPHISPRPAPGVQDRSTTGIFRDISQSQQRGPAHLWVPQPPPDP